MHHGTCHTHVPLCMPRSLTSGSLWSRRRGKPSRHSRRMHNQQFYVCDRRPMLCLLAAYYSQVLRRLHHGDDTVQVPCIYIGWLIAHFSMFPCVTDIELLNTAGTYLGHYSLNILETFYHSVSLKNRAATSSLSHHMSIFIMQHLLTEEWYVLQLFIS